MKSLGILIILFILILPHMSCQQIDYIHNEGIDKVDHTIAYGPHFMSYPNYFEKLDQLHSIGVSEIYLAFFGYSLASYDSIEVFYKRGVSSKDIEVANYAKSKGMKLTAQIRINPKMSGYAEEFPDDYVFYWWGGFINLPEEHHNKLFDLIDELCVELITQLPIDSIIVSHEFGQGIQYNPERWISTVELCKGYGVEVEVALNTWQPLKYISPVDKIIELDNKKQFATFIADSMGFSPPQGVTINWDNMMAPLPSWLDSLDYIGIDSYHLPTFKYGNYRSILNSYYWMLEGVYSMKSKHIPPIICTETGLELETGVPRDLVFASDWWKATFDFWFYNVDSNTVVVWEHDVDFFLEVVENIGGLNRWINKEIYNGKGY